MARRLLAACLLGAMRMDKKFDGRINSGYGHGPFGAAHGVKVSIRDGLSEPSLVGAIRVIKKTGYDHSHFRLDVPIRLDGLTESSLGGVTRTAKKKFDERVQLGYNFGHSPFGADYGVKVPVGPDGLPEFVDWTKVPGAVMTVKNQLSCGSCYIMAAVAAVESLNFIKTGISVDLSIQQILDCNTVTSNGHFGGYPQSVFDFIIRNGGIVLEAAYPYTGKRGVCENITTEGVTIDGWRQVIPNNEDAMRYAVAHQPVVVSICADKKFITYKQGIMEGPSYWYSRLDHSVLLVGYDQTSDGKLYWILMNSHGQTWGLNGIGWIARKTGQKGGAYGILRDGCVPIKWSPNAIVTTRCESCCNCF